MPKGAYTRISRRANLDFDLVTAARLARAAERDETTVPEMLAAFITHNIDVIDAPQEVPDAAA